MESRFGRPCFVKHHHALKPENVAFVLSRKCVLNMADMVCGVNFQTGSVPEMSVLLFPHLLQIDWVFDGAWLETDE